MKFFSRVSTLMREMTEFISLLNYALFVEH